eukprot:scaffold978_cov230-Chaetoceros_neogracile.AAC.12
MGKGGNKLDEIFLPRGMKKSRPPSSSSSVSSIRSRSVKAAPSSGASVSSSRSTSSRTTTGTSKRSAATAPLRDINSRSSAKQSISSSVAKKVEKLESKNEELTSKNSQLRRKCAETELILESIEKERDFYFDKLRGIEVFLQVHEEKNNKESGEEDSDPEALIQRAYPAPTHLSEQQEWKVNCLHHAIMAATEETEETTTTVVEEEEAEEAVDIAISTEAEVVIIAIETIDVNIPIVVAEDEMVMAEGASLETVLKIPHLRKASTHRVPC